MHSNIRDDDAVLHIDVKTRQIVVPAGGNVIGVAGDHGSEQLTFQCPRMIEGRDVAGCAVKWIGWVNAKGETGQDDITGMTTTRSCIYFTWTPSSGLTVKPGGVSIAINFMDLDGEGNVLYKWSTGACKDMRVLDGIYENVEYGVDLAYSEPAEDSRLLQLEVNDPKLNAEVYAAVRRALYG